MAKRGEGKGGKTSRQIVKCHMNQRGSVAAMIATNICFSEQSTVGGLSVLRKCNTEEKEAEELTVTPR